ncbi:MAG: hypothetical protein PVS2B2_25700 [Candidatus Acidiferrum sp.]
MQAEAKIAPEELFVLTDEQILEIEPETQEAMTGAPRTLPREEGTGADEHDRANRSAPADEQKSEPSSAAEHGSPNADREGGPPEWLAQRMRDPWNGTEAREFWDSVQREKQETAAYREVFAKPEEARATAERARVFDEIDRAYFGAPGKPAEELSASRTQLAQRMMREDPAAFREMVFAGLRALEGTEGSANATATGENRASGQAPRDAKAPAPEGGRHNGAGNELVGQYAAFEKAANDDLERSVGVVIEKALQQALPNAAKTDGGALKGRLNATIRQEIEKSLQDDRQLGQQVSRLLASRTFDDATRAQVVRLIGERAAQLVPSAAKRVLGDWTQTAMAAQRTRAQREDEATSRKDLAPSAKSRSAQRSEKRPDPNRGASRLRGVDYRKFSDEQILEM